MKLESYGLCSRNSHRERMEVSKSVHSAWHFHRGSFLGRSSTTSSIWKYPYHSHLCAQPVLQPPAEHALVVWCVALGGEWCRGRNSRTVYVASGVGGGLAVRRVSWLKCSRTLCGWGAVDEHVVYGETMRSFLPSFNFLILMLSKYWQFKLRDVNGDSANLERLL
jgi:hypothetical protein